MPAAAGTPDLRVHAAGPAGAWLVLLIGAPLAPAAAALAVRLTAALGVPTDARPLGRLGAEEGCAVWIRALRRCARRPVGNAAT